MDPGDAVHAIASGPATVADMTSSRNLAVQRNMERG
jgi:glycerate-2-kinase